MRKTLFILMGILATNVSADFLIHPQKIIFQGKERSKSIQITNMGNTPKVYKMSFSELFPTKDGGYRNMERRNGKLVFVDKYVDSNKKQRERISLLSVSQAQKTKLASPYIDYSPRKITLKPQQSQVIRLMLNKKARFKDAREIRSHFYIQEVNVIQEAQPKSSSKKLSFQIQGLQGVTIPVIARFGNTSVEGEFKKMYLSNISGKAHLNLTLSRKGNQSLRGNIIVYKKEGIFSSDTEIGRIGNFAVYSNLTERKIKIPLHEGTKNLKVNELKGEEIIIKFEGDSEDCPDINFETKLNL